MNNLMKSRKLLEESLLSLGGGEELLTESRQKILSLEPMELLQKLREGELSAVKVLEAFQAKAICESKRTNCVTEFILDAKMYAEDLESRRSSLDLSTMPLFGIPLSVKEMIHVKGTDSTLGLRKLVNNPSEEDSTLVQLFRTFGAIPFVKTNNPQSCMSFNCSNPVYGETLNPHNLERSCGGSSGGEGALIGAGGSVLGIGTDIAGSVRVPAHFCGIATIRPTIPRILSKGIARPSPKQVGVCGTMGVMGKDAAIVVEAYKALFKVGMTHFSTSIPPVEWRDHLFQGTVERPLKNKLRIGWYADLGIFSPTPGVERSVIESVTILKKLGHDLVPFAPPNVDEAVQLYYDFLFADGGKFITNLLEGEIVDKSVEFFKDTSCASKLNSEFTKSELKEKYGEYVSNLQSPIDTVDKIWSRQMDKIFYLSKFEEAWKNAGLDLVLCPVWPIPAAPKGFDSSLFAISVYTKLYNLLDYPSGVVPVTRETEEDQKALQDYNTKDCRLHKLIKEYTKGATGLPLGVQFVALPFCEEIICRIMLEFSKAVNFQL